MRIGVKFGNGLQLAVDLGNAQSIGTVIRMVGARAAKQIRVATEQLASRTTARMKEKKR